MDIMYRHHVKEVREFIYNLSAFPKKLHEGSMGVYVTILSNDGEFNYVLIFACGEISFSLRDVHRTKSFTVDYGNTKGLSESIKFYCPHNDAFYCFENVKKTFEEAITTNQQKCDANPQKNTRD